MLPFPSFQRQIFGGIRGRGRGIGVGGAAGPGFVFNWSGEDRDRAIVTQIIECIGT